MSPSLAPRSFLVVLAVAAALPLAACNKDVGSPEVAAERFFARVRAKDHRAIWDSLSKDARQRLRDRHAKLVEATGDADDPEAIIDALGLVALSESKTPVIVSPLGDRVTVRLSGPRGSTDLHLVREGPDWKVDLTATLTSSVADEHP